MFLRCHSCDAKFDLRGDHEPLEEDVKKGAVKCPMCFDYSVVLTSVKNKLKGQVPTELTKQQFWAATHGFGLPDELVTEPEVVEAMLLAHRVKKVNLAKTVSGHVVIYELGLDNGITLHFTASGAGAVIFKSTRTKEKNNAS